MHFAHIHVRPKKKGAISVNRDAMRAYDKQLVNISTLCRLGKSHLLPLLLKPLRSAHLGSVVVAIATLTCSPTASSAPRRAASGVGALKSVRATHARGMPGSCKEIRRGEVSRKEGQRGVERN
jgi:hypothetical protein